MPFDPTLALFFLPSPMRLSHSLASLAPAGAPPLRGHRAGGAA